MTNCEFYKSPEEARKAYAKYMQHKDYRTKDIDIVNWLYKSADPALQFEIGQILQLNNGDRINPSFAYIRVDDFEYSAWTQTYLNIIATSASFSRLSIKITERALNSTEIPKKGETRLADIPAEFVSLVKCPNIERCPLKDEGVCMREENNG